MKNKSVFILVLVVIFVTLVGCGGQGKTATGTQKPAGTDQTAKPKQPAWKPNRQVEIVIGFAAGGGNDIMSRRVDKIATDLKLLDKPFSLVNMEGAGGAIGAAYVAQKKGDPHFLIPISGMFWLSPLLSEGPAVNVVNDFTPLAQFGSDTEVLAVPVNSPYKTFDDVVQAAKAKPGKITWGTAGPTSAELEIINAVEKVKGVKFNIVPFSGGGDAVKALLGGHVDISGREPGAILEYVKGGQLRPLATTYGQRVDAFPDLPTLTEMGIPCNYYQVRGIAAPAGISPEAVTYYENLFKQISDSEEWKKSLKDASTIPDFKGSAGFAQTIKERWDNYTKVYGEMGLLPKKK